MALVTKVASTAPAFSDAQRSAPEESADRWRRYPRQHFVVELQLLTLLFAHQQWRSSSAVVADFSCSATESSLIRGSAGVAGPDVHPSWQQYRRHVRYLTVTPGDAFRELKYLTPVFST